MGSAWHQVSAFRRPTARWSSLLACALAVACGGEREASPDAGPGSVATADTTSAPAAPTPTASDTMAASASADTAKPGRDTAPAAKRTSPAATQPAKPAATPTPRPKQAPRPTQKPAPEPAAAPAPSAETSASAPAGDTAPNTGTAATTSEDTATGAAAEQPTTPDQAAAAQETTATAQDSPQTAQQTPNEPLRDAYHQAPKDTVDQATYNGWKQYNLNCARCHGEDVLGSTIAPHLIMSMKPDGPIPTQEAFTQVVCAGRPEKGMPSWCALGMEPAKINEIYAYVKGRSEAKLGPGRPALREGS